MVNTQTQYSQHRYLPIFRYIYTDLYINILKHRYIDIRRYKQIHQYIDIGSPSRYTDTSIYR